MPESIRSRIICACMTDEILAASLKMVYARHIQRPLFGFDISHCSSDKRKVLVEAVLVAWCYAEVCTW